MAQNIYTLKMNKDDADKLFAAWKEYRTEKAPAYARWQLRPENCVITCYESGKVVFQGKDAHVYASPFLTETEDRLPQAGSDEVGTGDYFGPVVVSACIVREEDLPLIRDLGIRDSKALSDQKIMEAAPVLMEKLVHTKLIVDNEKYNRIHEKYNMNEIKALLHNQAYINLSKKGALPSFRVIDQFMPEAAYYRALRNEPEVIGQMHFETKAENKYPAVGAASVIARYTFLQCMHRMDEKYGMHFSLGAGSAADASAREFVKRYGTEELRRTAKVHFRNTEALRSQD